MLLKLSLSLEDEEFTSSDQFRVDVSVFEKTDDLSSDEWHQQKLFFGVDGKLTSKEQMTINGFDVTRYEADYSEGASKEIRITYILVKDDIGIRLATALFDGDHYSYENSRDYLVYEEEIDAIVRSIGLSEDT